MQLIRGAECFCPAPMGVCDVLIAGGEVLAIAEAGTLSTDSKLINVEHIDGSGMLLTPGLVDSLTHPCGGGGEGGFVNRTEEISPGEFVAAGVTSPVGALGTDSLGRSLEVLYGNVMGLRAAGLRAFMYSGAYRVPPPTLTGDVARDLYLVAPVIGVGEVAIADHRGTQPSAEELRRLAAEVSLGGILAGEGGTVMIHVGAESGRLSRLREAIDGSDLSPRLFYPTHVNRSIALLEEAAEWAQRGGFVDITVSTTPELIAKGDIPADRALQHLLDAGAPAQQITMSSDAGGSLPLYIDGELRGLTAAKPAALSELLCTLKNQSSELFPVALAAMTANPAAALGLLDLGTLAVGKPADLIMLDTSKGTVDAVMCAGRWLQAGESRSTG